MWAWTPTSSREEINTGAATASAAAPEETENPNLESSCPVRTNSWVCASTPGVTRTSTCGRRAAAGLAPPHTPLRALLGKGAHGPRAAPPRGRGRELVRRLVVAVQNQPLRRDAG